MKDLFLPIEWWSEKIGIMDRKIFLLSNDTGYGSVRMEIVIRDGKVKDVVLTDEVRMREKD